MIKIERINVMNIDNAIHGMRNPLESWGKSDTVWDYGCPVIGPNDLALAQKLVLAGSDHRKFMRQIFVSMDITAPLYWWKEMDQYRINCTTNSESTMHRLASVPITKELFSFDKESRQILYDTYGNIGYDMMGIDEIVIAGCEKLRLRYLETKDVRYWRALIQLLPSSWNQKRTWTANFEVLRNICHARENHKLQEWCEFVQYIYNNAPYAKELIFYKGE